MFDLVSSESSCCTRSDTNVDEPNTTMRVSGGECSISRVVAALWSVFSGLATLLANPPTIETAMTWLPFLSAGRSLGTGKPSPGYVRRSGETIVDDVNHDASDDRNRTSTLCVSSPTLVSALTGVAQCITEPVIPLVIALDDAS